MILWILAVLFLYPAPKELPNAEPEYEIGTIFYNSRWEQSYILIAIDDPSTPNPDLDKKVLLDRKCKYHTLQLMGDKGEVREQWLFTPKIDLMQDYWEIKHIPRKMK